MQGVAVAAYPNPGLELQQDDHRLQRALDWYLKGMAAALQVDQFMFWWVAAELLRVVSGVSRVEPIVPRCGHQLTHCPECGEPTTRELLGASMQAFLVESGGLDVAVARQARRTRQIVHGNVALDSTKLENLPALTPAGGFKRWWQRAEGPPEHRCGPAAVHRGGRKLLIDPHMALGGTTTLEDRVPSC